MNKSDILKTIGRTLLIFPLIFLVPFPVVIRITLIVIWLVLILIFKYPQILAYFALISYEKRGKDTFKNLMSRAYLSGRVDPKSAATYSYILLRDGELEKSSEVLDYAELTAHERMKWRKGRMKYYHVHSYRALILWKQGRLDDAAKLLLGLLDDDYRTSILYANLGWFLIKQEKYEDALKINLEALEYDRSNAILDNIGLVYMKMGDLKKSREFYEELIDNNPTFPDAWYNFGCLLNSVGEYEKAQEMFLKSLSCNFSYLGTISKREVELAVHKSKR